MRINPVIDAQSWMGIKRMKKYHVVLFSALLAHCWLGCSNEVDPDDYDNAELACLIDGKVWTPHVPLFSRFPLSQATYQEKSLYLGATREIGRGNVEFFGIHCDSVNTLGEQHIVDMQFGRSDQLFEVVMPGTASVYLTMLDTVGHRVAGTFRATFVNDSVVFLKVEDGHFNFKYSGG